MYQAWIYKIQIILEPDAVNYKQVFQADFQLKIQLRLVDV